MSQKNYSSLPGWEKIKWEQTPYRGVFIYKIEEKKDSSKPSIPLYTIMALKVEPEAEIPLHKHNREPGWTETITFANGGEFETRNDRKSRKIKTKKPFTIVIQAGEIFGLKNMDDLQSLYFFSRMEPGFTGYGEIEEARLE